MVKTENKREPIDKTLYRYKKLGKQDPKIPRCELCGYILKADREWVCTNCGLVNSPILDGGVEKPADESFVSESSYSKYMRETLHDSNVHKELERKIYFQEYHKEYYKGFRNIKIYRPTHERFSKFCLKKGFTQYKILTNIVEIVLDILEEIDKNEK